MRGIFNPIECKIRVNGGLLEFYILYIHYTCIIFSGTIFTCTLISLPNGRYIPDIELISPSSPLYPDTIIVISLQGESVISFNCNT